MHAGPEELAIVAVGIAAATFCLVCLLWWLFPRFPFVVVGCGLFVAVVSLLLSYGLDTPFRERFGRVGNAHIGCFIEAFRHVAYAMVFLRVLGTLFFEETRTFFSLSGTWGWWFARGVFVLVVASILCKTTQYHVTTGPNELLSSYVKHNESSNRSQNATAAGDNAQSLQHRQIKQGSSSGYQREYVTPYLFYLPQSLLHFLLWAAPLAFIPISAAARDWSETEAIITELTTDLLDGAAVLKKKDAFLHFCCRTRQILAKYLEIPLWMMSVLAFEILIGFSTLSDTAKTFHVFELTVISLSGLMFILGALQYQRLYLEFTKHCVVDCPEWIVASNPWTVMVSAARDSVAIGIAAAFGTSVFSWVISRIV